MIDAQNIFILAFDAGMQYLAAPLLVLSALAVADELTAFLIRLLKRSSKEYYRL